MVTEKLKKQNFLSMDTSEKSAFYSDSKYIRFIKFSVTHQSYQPDKTCLILGLAGKHPLQFKESKSHHQVQYTRGAYCRSFKLLYTKMWNHAILPEEDACLFYFFFFSGVTASK